MEHGITADEMKYRAGGASRRNLGNNNELENESGSVGPGDFGRTAFMWFAWNSLFAVILTAGTFACYQLPSFKNDCETDNPGNCIVEESSDFSVAWIIPIIFMVLLFGGFMKLSIPIFTSKFIRRTLFKGTPSTKAVNAQGNPVIKLRTTMWAWLVLLALIAQTITLTVVASTVIDDRCRPESIARAKAEGLANFVTRFFGSFAYGAQNNWDYNLVNFVSLFNPRYWLWITLSLAIIYSMMSMTGEQVKKAKQAYKTGKQTALKAGKSASAASREGLKAGAKAFGTTPMTGALGKGGGNAVKPGSKKQQMLREKRDAMMPTVAKVAATGHKGAQATMQKTYPQTALGAKGAATRARVKAITALAEKEKAAQKLQSAARGRAVRAPLQTAKTQAAAAAAFQSAGAQKAATAKMQAGAAAFAGAGKRKPSDVLAAARKAKAQQDAVLKIQQAQRARVGGAAKQMAMKSQSPVNVKNRVAAYNGGRRPASAASRVRTRPGSAIQKARSRRPHSGPTSRTLELADNRSPSQRGPRPVKKVYKDRFKG